MAMLCRISKGFMKVLAWYIAEHRDTYYLITYQLLIALSPNAASLRRVDGRPLWSSPDYLKSVARRDEAQPCRLWQITGGCEQSAPGLGPRPDPGRTRRLDQALRAMTH
jgi:hypothetical protein